MENPLVIEFSNGSIIEVPEMPTNTTVRGVNSKEIEIVDPEALICLNEFK